MDVSMAPPPLVSKVLIVMTGGTICMRDSPNGLIPARNFLEEGMATRPSFNDGSPRGETQAVIDDEGTRRTLPTLKTPPSTFKRQVEYTVLEFDELLDSSAIDSAGWAAIGKTIYRNYGSFDGFVVLHGTDSLAYTCSALSFMLQNLAKPVVFTGSQAPIFQLQNDAVDNLLGSLLIAGHYVIPEVTLYFHSQLFRGNRATKVSATSFAAFSSPNFPPLATITAVGTDVHWHRVRQTTRSQPLTLHDHLDTAKVACLRIFPGMKPSMIEAVANAAGLRGLVIESFGAGNTPGGEDSEMTGVLASLVEREIVVVNITQCLSGAVSALYAPATALQRKGIVLGEDLTSEAALTKLSYLLSLPGATAKWVASQMAMSLRGELTERSKQLFEHPTEEQLPPAIAAFTAVAYAIAEGNVGGVAEALELPYPSSILEAVDYNGNTALVSGSLSTIALV